MSFAKYLSHDEHYLIQSGSENSGFLTLIYGKQRILEILVDNIR